MKKYRVLDFTIVIVGDMPVRLFTPYWLAKHNLINDKEAESSDIKALNPQIVRYDIADWASIEITEKRFVISTVSDAHHETVRDIIQSLLTVLEGNHITNLGINHIYTFDVNIETYINIGNFLAPFKNWNNILDEPRLLNIEMIQESRNDKFDGKYRIRVNPVDVPKGYAFSFNINSHFDIRSDVKESANEAAEILEAKYDESHNEANEFLNQFWNNFDNYDE